MCLVASRNIWFGDSIIPLRLTAASTFCTQKLFAFADYCNNVMGPPESYSMWNQRSQTVPQFKFWSMIIELELLMTRFVRSLREGDFPLYVQACNELCSWFHALDHTNYARWLPVHVLDMVQLAQQNPEMHAEFMRGKFVVQKSCRKFSPMAKDQAHEQSNKILQTKCGAAGLYENHEVLMLLILAVPDRARMVEEFEAIHDPPPYSPGHHEERRSLQATLRKDIPSFAKVVGQLGNPFVATSLELVALDTPNVLDESVVASLSEIREVGQTLHAAYVRERLEDSSVPISDIIKRNNMLTFANRPELRKKAERMLAYNDVT